MQKNEKVHLQTPRNIFCMSNFSIFKLNLLEVRCLVKKFETFNRRKKKLTMLRALFSVSTIMKNEQLVIPHLKVVRNDAPESQDTFQNFQKIINLSRNYSASLSLHRMEAPTFNFDELEVDRFFQLFFQSD